MPAERYGEPWPGATYNGFSGPAAASAEPPRRAAAAVRRPSRGALAAGGIAAAVALGLTIGLLARPDHRALSVDKDEAAVAPRVPIQVSPPLPPPPVPKAAGKLEVLPPGAAEAARPAWTTTPPPPGPRAAPLSLPAGPLPVPAAPVQHLAQAAPPPVVVAPAPLAVPPPVRADACASRSRAEALVCADPELAAYDRDLNRAYRRALRSGAVSPEDLRADQRDWLTDREAAARRSPRAMSELYQDRIEELNRIADDGPGL